MPLVECGLVNLIPDPCDFDAHLRDQMLNMARSRSAGIDRSSYEDEGSKELFEQDFKRNLMSLPREILRSQILQAMPHLDEANLELSLRAIDQMRERDPLSVLQEGSFVVGEKNGQLSVLKLAPNFEMTIYLAQATGSCIVTDSPFRWSEIRRAMYRRMERSSSGLPALARSIKKSTFAFPQNVAEIVAIASDKTCAGYPALMRDVSKYLSKLSERGPKPNVEGHLTARFARAHTPAQTTIKKVHLLAREARISCAFPAGGIQDNTVNRLLLMSSSENHLPNVPMAFFIEEQVARGADGLPSKPT
jgi:hypothetical protein